MKITLLGDVMIQDIVAEAVAKDDGWALSERLAHVIDHADVAVANLETMICPPGLSPANEWHSPPEAARILAQAGVSAVSVATNHTWDHGPEAIRNTLDSLNQHGVACFGLGGQCGDLPGPLILQGQDWRVALVGYASASNVTKRQSFTARAPSNKAIRKDLSALREGYDAVIVSIHHGFGQYPSPELRSWCKAAAEAGANAVMVHHSHIISGFEVIDDCVVGYGLANIVGDSIAVPDRQGLTLKLEVKGRRLVNWEWSGIVLDEQGYPTEGTQQQQIHAEVDRINADLARQDYDKFYWTVFGENGRAAYIRYWREALKKQGLSAIFRKLKRFRASDLRILWNILCRR